jgi:hypothetical protein
MAIPKFADFKPQTRITDRDFGLLESEGGIRLSPEQRLTIANALREYEFLRVLKEEGEGEILKKALRILEARTGKFIEGIQAVKNEPGHIWEYLLAESDAKVSGLQALLTKCKELNKKVARRGRKKDFFLDSLLLKLADVFLRAGGKKTGISKGAPERGGLFLRFAFAATNCLPKKFNLTKEGLGNRWERIRKAQRTQKVHVHMWVGGPHPASAKPWYEKRQV